MKIWIERLNRNGPIGSDVEKIVKLGELRSWKIQFEQFDNEICFKIVQFAVEKMILF